MHLTRWAAADSRLPTPHLLEKCARNRDQGDRGAEKRAAGACAWSLRGRCSGVEEHQVCVGRSRRVCPQSLCAGRGCRKCLGRAQPRTGGARRDACGNFSPAPQVRVPAFRGAVLRRQPRVPAPPPLPPPASSSFPAPRAARSPGNPAGTAPPGRRCSLPRPRRRLSGAHPASQKARALQVGGNAGWAQVRQTGPPQHRNVGCPPPPARTSPTRQSPFREFFASCLLRRGWGRGRGRSFSISLVLPGCQPPISKSLLFPVPMVV